MAAVPPSAVVITTLLALAAIVPIDMLGNVRPVQTEAQSAGVGVGVEVGVGVGVDVGVGVGVGVGVVGVGVTGVGVGPGTGGGKRLSRDAISESSIVAIIQPPDLVIWVNILI